MLRNLLTSNILLALVSTALLAAGVAISIGHHDFHWLARFGALVICGGIILLARPAILGQDIRSHILKEETGLSHIDPEHYRKLGEPIPDFVKQDLRSRTAVGWLGPLFCFIGTAATGFGDLINALFGYV